MIINYSNNTNKPIMFINGFKIRKPMSFVMYSIMPKLTDENVGSKDSKVVAQ
jgi:hypothetical protein